MRSRPLICVATLVAAACSDGIGLAQLNTFASVASGTDFTCGLLGNRAAYCWGNNTSMQLGTGAANAHDSLPRPVSTQLTFSSIDAGETRACAITHAGAAYCWGGSAPIPVALEGGLTFKAITLGYSHACGLTPTGAAYCWGDNEFGKLGRDIAVDSVNMPVPVEGGHTFIAIAAGGFHTCAIAVGGAAYCWGRNWSGTLGTGTQDTTRIRHPVPELVAGGHQFTAIDGGNAHTCGLTTGGDVYCWGFGGWGQLGDGARATTGTPVLVSGGHTFTRLSLGLGHSCGLAVGGRLYCWGYDPAGQVGAPAPGNCAVGVLGDSVPCASTPIAVSTDLTFRAAAAGGYHTCAIGSRGSAYCWGGNGYGQVGNGSAGGIVRAVARVPDPTRPLGVPWFRPRP